MSSTEAKKPKPHESTLVNLFAVLKDKPPLVHQRIAAHVRAVTGIGNVGLLHNSRSHTDEQKDAIYKELIHAVSTGNLDLLKGTVAQGDKRIDPIEAARETAGLEQTDRVNEETPTDPNEPVNRLEPPCELNTDATDELSILSRAIFKRIAPHLPKGKAVDADAVKRIAEEVFAHKINNGGFPVDRVKQLIAEHAQNNVTRVEVVRPDGSVQSVSGLAHKLLPEAIKMASARTLDGYAVPLWLEGPPGAGKTHMMEQIAEAFGVAPYVLAISPTDTKSVIVGYRNLANGEYVPGIAYEAYKNGGVLGIDECTNGDPGILVSCNSLVSNKQYRFPNGELVTKHKDFYVVVGDNTKGTGSTGGFVRNKLDAATLDRFPMLHVDYDHDLEVALCGDKKWADYVLKVRRFIEQQGKAGVYITPRASINGAALLRAGIAPEHVCDRVLFKLVSADTKATILANCGHYTP